MDQTAALAEVLAEAAVEDGPPVVLETKTATIAVAKVSELGGAEMEVDTGAQELPGIQPPSAVPPTLQRQCLCELHRALAGVEWGARVHP